VAKTYDLHDVVPAQEDFMTKRYTGKLAIQVSAQG